MENNLFNDNSIDNQQIIKKITDFYNEEIETKPQILRFLTEKQWLTKDEIETFKVGYSDGQLTKMVKRGVLKEKIKELRFLTSRGRECFRGYITFPVIDQNGIYRDVIGFKYKFFKKNDTSRIQYLREQPFIEVSENIRNIIEKLTELRIKSEEEYKTENDLFFQYGDRTYRVRGLNPFYITKLKINLMVTQDEQTFIDNVDLYTARNRKGLINQLSEIFDEEKGVMLKEIENLIQRLDKIRLQMKNKKELKQNTPPPVSKEERENITSVLKNTNLLKMIEEDLTKIGIAGEEKNKVMLYMMFTSRKLRKPLSVIVKGDSAGGKSYLVSQVLKLFPDEDIKNFTEVSAKSLFYMTEDALEHKILVIFERHGSEASDYSIRSLQSENKLKLAVTLRDPQTSEFKTVEKIVRGPISYAETSTKLSIHAENATRMFDLYIDESTSQTKKIHEIQNLEYLPNEKIDERDIEKIMKKHHLIQRILEPVKVVIPYVRLIEFPVNKLRLRRDRMRFLALIETFAFIYQFQRVNETIKGEEYIIADIQDYQMAYELAESIMADTLSILHPKSRELLDKIKEINKEDFSVSDISEETGWGSMKIRRHIKQLIEEDFIEQKISGKGKRGIYKICSKRKAGREKLEGLPTPEELKKKLVQLNKSSDEQVKEQVQETAQL